MSVSILVVDDETDVAELFRQQFRHEARQGTYVLHFAYSGEELITCNISAVAVSRSSASSRSAVNTAIRASSSA